MPRTYIKKTRQLERSYDCNLNAGISGNPWKMLASAIIFQAAVDCTYWNPEFEKDSFDGGYQSGIRYMRFNMLRDFINSDWIDTLLSYQSEITPEAVCEELVRRLCNETVST